MPVLYPRSARAVRSRVLPLVPLVPLVLVSEDMLLEERELRVVVSLLMAPELPVVPDAALGDVLLGELLLMLPEDELGVLLLMPPELDPMPPAVEPVVLPDEPLLAAPVVFGPLPLGAVCVFVDGPGVSLADGGLVFLPVSLIAPELVPEGLVLVCA
jgi:hypothetical protein